jgi:methyl-accepting chemotaxis protein
MDRRGRKIADTLNDIIELSDKTAKELERVSRVVGKEGKIAHRASVPAAGGSWLRLVDSTNLLIDDMARPTSEMARVIGAVANGDLSERMALEVEGRPLKGEFLRTVKIVNSMVDQLGSFASEVTRVAREVGTEGKLGGEAKVKGVAGTLEGSHRQCELDGRQPHRAGPQHRRSDHGRGQRRPLKEKSRSM